VEYSGQLRNYQQSQRSNIVLLGEKVTRTKWRACLSIFH
jgi:hypothetical protein